MNLKGNGSLIPTANGHHHYLGIILDDFSEMIKKIMIEHKSEMIKNGFDFAFLDNALKRNSNHQFHITLAPFINDDTSAKFLVKCLTSTFTDLEPKGIGKVEKDDNQSWFIPIYSKQLKSLSDKYGVDLSNLHITIGFDKNDIHGVDKSKANVIDFDMEKGKKMIGRTIEKKSGKPFKNGLLTDKVYGVGINPHSNKPAVKLTMNEWVDINMIKINK